MTLPRNLTDSTVTTALASMVMGSSKVGGGSYHLRCGDWAQLQGVLTTPAVQPLVCMQTGRRLCSG